MKNIALVGGSLALVACGGGAYSADATDAAQTRSTDRTPHKRCKRTLFDSLPAKGHTVVRHRAAAGAIVDVHPIRCLGL